MNIYRTITPLLLIAAISYAEPPYTGKSQAGDLTRGLSLELKTTAPLFTTGSKPELWAILRNTNHDDNGQIIPYDEDSVGYGYITVIDTHGNTSVISNFCISEGMRGYGFEGGLGYILQNEYLRPETYALQWIIGELQSNIITMKVTEVETEIDSPAQQSVAAYPPQGVGSADP